jgi:hypothetical protein
VEEHFHVLLRELDCRALIVAYLTEGARPNKCGLLAYRPENVYGAGGHTGATERAQVFPDDFSDEVTEQPRFLKHLLSAPSIYFLGWRKENM